MPSRSNSQRKFVKKRQLTTVHFDTLYKFFLLLFFCCSAGVQVHFDYKSTCACILFKKRNACFVWFRLDAQKFDKKIKLIVFNFCIY